MKKALWIFLLVIFLGAFAWTIVYLINKQKQPDVVYVTSLPEVKNIINKTVATGSVVPRKEIEIKPKVSGIVETIYVVAGQLIKKNDLIAKVRIIPNMVSLNNAESRVNKAKLLLKNAETEFYRQEKLFKDKVIAEAQFQEYKLTFDNAKEELDASENNLQLIKEGILKQSGQVSNTLIRSTISGMVLDVPVIEGHSVIESNTFNNGTTIASVADMGEMIFEGNIDESEVGKIETGMDLIVKIGAIEDETFKAKLEFISPKGVEENGAIQFEIRASLELRDSSFVRAGYSANADIVLARKDSVLSINESLLQFKDDSPYVEVETSEQVFEKRPVKVGISDGIDIEIVAGISADEKIKNWNETTNAEGGGRRGMRRR